MSRKSNFLQLSFLVLPCLIAGVCIWFTRITFWFNSEVTFNDVDKHISYVQPYLNTSRKLVHQICKSSLPSSRCGSNSPHRFLGIWLPFWKRTLPCLFLTKLRACVSGADRRHEVKKPMVLPGKPPVHNETTCSAILNARRCWFQRAYSFLTLIHM